MSRPINGRSLICCGVMLVLTSVFVWSTSGTVLVTSTVSLTAPGSRVKFCVVVLPTSSSTSFASAVENPAAVVLSEYLPADSDSNLYSPASLVLAVEAAFSAFLGIVPYAVFLVAVFYVSGVSAFTLALRGSGWERTVVTWSATGRLSG